MSTDIESIANGHEDLKVIVRNIRRSDEEWALARHSSKVDEPSTKQFEGYLQGLKDLQSFAHQATYVIDSAYTVIRDTKQRLEAIGGPDWERVVWSALICKTHQAHCCRTGEIGRKKSQYIFTVGKDCT